MEIKTTNHNRILWLDVSKCIGILVVIALHTFGGMILKVSLSFVIPMFFVLSGITFKPSDSFQSFIKNIKKSSVRLLIPPTAIWFITSLFNISGKKISILTIVFQRCENMQIGSYHIDALGILWFLSALFSARLIFDFVYLHIDAKKIPYIVILFTIIGVLMGHYGLWLPLNLDIGFSMQFFVYSGYIFNNYKNKINTLSLQLIHTVCSIALYSLLFITTCLLTKDYLNIPAGIYPLFPLCFFTALFGSMSVILISITLEEHFCKDSKFKFADYIASNIKILAKIGKYSMCIYCVHSLDYLISFIWNSINNLTITYLIRIICDAGLSLIVIFLIKNASHKKAKN